MRTREEHVRGVVTQLSPQSITVQTTGTKTTTLKVTAKTTFQLAGKAATLADLKVGDRVVIDVSRNHPTLCSSRSGQAQKGARKARHRVYKLAEADENRR